MFCSDAFLFKLANSTPAVTSSEVRPCTPTGLTGTRSDTQLAITWDNPDDPTVASYEIRHKLANSSWPVPEAWTAVTPVTSHTHTITGLTAGHSHDVEVRAKVSAGGISGLRSPAASFGDRPAAPCTGTVTAAVSPDGGGIVKAGATTVPASGVALACGSHVLTAGPTANYAFSSWSSCPAGGASDATCTVTVGKAHTASAPLSVSATFTQKDCTVTGNVKTLDTANDVLGTAGGRIRANGTTSASATVPCGNDVTLTKEAFTGYSFNRWEGCTSLSTNKEVCTVTTSGLSQQAYATATFRQEPPPPTYLVTVTKTGSGTGTVSPSSGQYRGWETFTATATGDSLFGGWSGCDRVNGSSCSVNVTAARTITATFNPPPTYLVTVKKAGSGTGTVSPGGGQYRGWETFTATATGNSVFGGWSGCDRVNGASCSVNVTRARAITATFNPPPTYLVTVRKAGSGTGTVSPSGGHYRGSQSFTATATGGSTFGGWSGCDSVTGASCSVNVTRARTITATFNPPPTYLVTVKKAGSGTGTVSPGSGRYRGWRTFTATATGASVFGGWSGCDRVNGSSCSVNVTRARTITATFKPPQCTVVAVASKGGTVSGGGTVDCGTAVTLRATAKAGHCFSYWNQLIAPGDFAQATSSVCLTRGSLNVTTSSGTRNQIYQAVFRAKRSYTLTVVGGSGSGSYLEGTWASASAPAGKCFLGTAYIFKRWSGDSTSTSRTVRVYMNSNKSVSATFTVAGTCPFAQAAEGEAAPHVVDDP